MTVHPTLTFPLQTRNNFKQLIKHILESDDTVDLGARAILLQLLNSCKTKQSEVKLLGIAAKDPTRMTIASSLLTALRNYGVFYDVKEDVHTNSILITKVDQPVAPPTPSDDVDIGLLEDTIAKGSVETAVNGNDEDTPADEPNTNDVSQDTTDIIDDGTNNSTPSDTINKFPTAPDGNEIVANAAKASVQDTKLRTDTHKSFSTVMDNVEPTISDIAQKANIDNNVSGNANDAHMKTPIANSLVDDGFIPVSKKDTKRGRSPPRHSDPGKATTGNTSSTNSNRFAGFIESNTDLDLQQNDEKLPSTIDTSTNIAITGNGTDETIEAHLQDTNNAKSDDSDDVQVVDVIEPPPEKPPRPYFMYETDGYQRASKTIEAGMWHLINDEDRLWFGLKSLKEINKQKSSTLGTMASRHREAIEDFTKMTNDALVVSLAQINGRHEYVSDEFEEIKADVDKRIDELKDIHDSTRQALTDASGTIVHYTALQSELKTMSKQVEELSDTNSALMARVNHYDDVIAQFHKKFDTMETAMKEQQAELETTMELCDAVQNLHDEKSAQPDHVPSMPSGYTRWKDMLADKDNGSTASKSEEPSVIDVDAPLLRNTQIRARIADGTVKHLWLTNWKVVNDHNYYCGKTSLGDTHYILDDDILEVTKTPSKDSFVSNYGYDPAMQHQWAPPATATPSPSKPKIAKGPPPPVSKLFPEAARKLAEESNYDDVDDHSYSHRARPQIDAASLGPESYISPTNSTRIKTIREDKLLKYFAVSTIVNDDTDFEEWYNDLKDSVGSYSIPMKPYKDLRPGATIWTISPDNCINYDAVVPTMSRCIYRILKANKERFFPNYSYLQSMHSNFADSSDGSGYLLAIISDYHDSFMHLTPSNVNITDIMEIPKFIETTDIYTWLRKLKKHVEETQSAKNTPTNILTYVRNQLKEDGRFTLAVTEIDNILIKHRHSNGYLPDSFILGNLSQWIFNLYPKAQRNTISQPRKISPAGPRISKLSSTNRYAELPPLDTMDYSDSSSDEEIDYTPAIAAMTRQQRRLQERKDKRDKPTSRHARRNDGNAKTWNDGNAKRSSPRTNHRSNESKTTQKPLPIRCRACRRFGHDIDKPRCPYAGSALAIDEWMQRLAPSERSNIIRAYEQQTRATHDRYIENYNARKQVRKAIRSMDVPDKREYLDEIAANSGPDFNINFASLDNDLLDDAFDEPFLLFDPANHDDLEKLRICALKY